jgi:hypothetical protein
MEFFRSWRAKMEKWGQWKMESVVIFCSFSFNF